MQKQLVRAAACLAVCLSFASSAAKADEIDDYVRGEMEKRKIPGISVAIVRDGQLLLAKGYGLANVELDVPATAATSYQIGSITKQFTATAAMLLVEEGKLGLDDPVIQHLPDLPSAWSEVTVRQLLNHTSGIKSFTGVKANVDQFRMDRPPQEIIDSVAAEPLEFQPGEKWAYNNTGYFLAGLVIEKAAGKTYADVLRERIFEPLGMSATRVNDQFAIVPNRADGYSFDGELKNGDYSSMTWPYSAGAIVSTVADLAKWDEALTAGKLLKPESYEAMYAKTTLSGGGEAGYGLGWGVAEENGRRVLAHSGGISGFTSHIARYVDDKLTVIVLCNLESGNPAGIAKGVAGQLVPELAPVAAAPIEDKDPATTEKLKAVLTATIEGKLDPELFTAEMKAVLFPDKAEQARESLSKLGEVKSFALVEAKEEAELKVYRYKIQFADAALILTAALTGEGKIAGMTVTPE